jgi:hypothetical protein
MRELIRHIIREETFMKVSDDKYSKLIKKAVLDYVDFYICGLSITKFPEVKDGFIVILIVEKYLKSSYRDELQEYLNDIIPLKTYVTIVDGQDCKGYRNKTKNIQIKESKIPAQVLRRHNLIDEMFEDMRSKYKRLFCKYRNPNTLLGVLYERTLSDLYHAWFYETVSDDVWEVATEYIQKYLKDKYEKETIDLWENRCKNGGSLKKEEETEGVGGYAAPAFEMEPDHVHFKHQYNEETELTEKCWKGYTQKGMKTMFGKRYPNCVKKTKK